MNSIFLDTINVMELMLDRTTSIACLSLSSVCLVKSSKELGFLLLYVHSRGKWFFPPLFYQGSPLSLSPSPLPVLPIFELHGLIRHRGAILPESRIKKNPTPYYLESGASIWNWASFGLVSPNDSKV